MKQMNLMMAALGISALVAIGGCKDDHDHADDHGKDGHTKTDGHKHGDKGDHGHEHKGEKHELGTHDVGGYPFSITQVIDPDKPQEAVLLCTTPLPKGNDVTGVVAWLGDAAGMEASGSKRVKAEKHGDGDFDAHVRLPKEIAAGSKYWIEATFADGKTAKASWAMKK